MNFLAVLDYEHLDNGMFLTAFARSLAQKKESGIIIHSDSEYTDRLIQTGMMREDARLRAIKDLNHRLIALFADQGVSTIGVNGYQKSLIQIKDDQIYINRDQVHRFPSQPMLLISGLAEDLSSKSPTALSLPDMALSFQNHFNINEITLFSMDESSSFIKGDFPMDIIPSEKDQDFLEKHIPKSFRGFNKKVKLSTPDTF
ncbi:hypothetical protein [Rhodohalobacter barkolensis]|uniref:Uncharacterized protein n=1 Tax=Rhodohalobacter barkolensis TaxID=2053187 RepID=A0A2N0VKX7_9BACT|nr:hypothetical protein [Rhodohalobacter barkolensis]PKD44848.1 hypothetical protein CWD77_05140 [Rhodohalobacter barkolensis]